MGGDRDATSEVCPGGRCTRFTAVTDLGDETGATGSIDVQALAGEKNVYMTDGLDAVSVDANLPVPND